MWLRESSLRAFTWCASRFLAPTGRLFRHFHPFADHHDLSQSQDKNAAKAFDQGVCPPSRTAPRVSQRDRFGATVACHDLAAGAADAGAWPASALSIGRSSEARRGVVAFMRNCGVTSLAVAESLYQQESSMRDEKRREDEFP